MCDGTNNNHVTQHPIQKESATRHRFSKKKASQGMLINILNKAPTCGERKQQSVSRDFLKEAQASSGNNDST